MPITAISILFLIGFLFILGLWIFGEFKNNRKARIIAFAMLIFLLLSSVIAFISAAIYSNYNHEHYGRGIVKIGNMINDGQGEAAKKAIEHFKNQSPTPELFSLERSLYIHKAIDKETNKTQSEPKDRPDR
ncbi:MAG TPA: hypothetical protein DCZ94_22315 [Lentisphaeria bacterium]|nr:MAG: hypothetical protein A2X48_13555 [Lentisphaerae bacterium GWF2_49_21]HBC89683.1 hypothetical protein [Lentisphaeria bacterium]